MKLVFQVTEGSEFLQSNIFNKLWCKYLYELCHRHIFVLHAQSLVHAPSATWPKALCSPLQDQGPLQTIHLIPTKQTCLQSPQHKLEQCGKAYDRASEVDWEKKKQTGEDSCGRAKKGSSMMRKMPTRTQQHKELVTKERGIEKVAMKEQWWQWGESSRDV